MQVAHVHRLRLRTARRLMDEHVGIAGKVRQAFVVRRVAADDEAAPRHRVGEAVTPSVERVKGTPHVDTQVSDFDALTWIHAMDTAFGHDLRIAIGLQHPQGGGVSRGQILGSM